MKKLLFLFLFSLSKIISSQNGFTTFSATIPVGANPMQEKAFLIDNSGNKWIGFSNSSPTSAVALACYNNIAGNWTFYNQTNYPNLPSNNITCLTKDNSGNIWIGTPSGLAKFNGTNFTPYTILDGLPSNNIKSLEWINTQLYVGTDAGLSRYDGSNFTNYNTGNALLPSNLIISIKAENSNTIWLGTNIGLFKFYINFNFTSTSFTLADPTFTIGAGAIYIDNIGNKWLSTSFGIYRYNNISCQPLDSLFTFFTGVTGFNANNFTKGPNNGILFSASYDYGKCLVELFNDDHYNLYYSPTYPIPSLRIGNLVENDGSGKIFTSSSSYITSNTNLPAMYSFISLNYNGFGIGQGGGVNGNNFKYLDINRVKAGIMNRGDMWWDIGRTGNAKYEVPKGKGVSGSFAASLWIGGLDASNQLHEACQTYRQSGNDFWPGPLDTTNASTDTATFINYDKIWKVSYIDINNFITNFNNGNIAANTYTPTNDILTWPAKGTGNHSRNLAPFVDINNNGIYDPLVGGDYPKIKGDETLYYIFNDNFTAHSETKALPLGVEVHAMAYAFGCSTILSGRNELAYTTFYNYKIYNRSNNNYHDMYIGFWNDADLGCYLDDYIGCSVDENLGFIYNSTGFDNTACAGTPAYGNFPPAAGTTILKGPLAPANDAMDNDNDGTIDEAGEEFLMNVFDNYFRPIGGPPLPPYLTRKYTYYNLLQGRWKDSTFFTYGGDGYGNDAPTKFVYPGRLCPPSGWTEGSVGNLSGDRLSVLSTGPFNFNAKQMTEIEYAYVWSVDSSVINNNLGSACKLISDVQKVRSFYSASPSNCLLSINVKENNDLNSQFIIYPNPGSSLLYVYSQSYFTYKATIKIMDVLGKTILIKEMSDLNHSAVNINELSAGVYFINVNFDNDRNIVKKFVKQ